MTTSKRWRITSRACLAPQSRRPRLQAAESAKTRLATAFVPTSRPLCAYTASVRASASYPPPRASQSAAQVWDLGLLQNFLHVERFCDAFKHRVRCRERLLRIIQGVQYASLIEAVLVRSK